MDYSWYHVLNGLFPILREYICWEKISLMSTGMKCSLKSFSNVLHVPKPGGEVRKVAFWRSFAHSPAGVFCLNKVRAEEIRRSLLEYMSWFR